MTEIKTTQINNHRTLRNAPSSTGWKRCFFRLVAAPVAMLIWSGASLRAGNDADPLDVGILAGETTSDEFDVAFSELKWKSRKYSDEEKGWKDLQEGLKKHDLLLGTSDFSKILPRKEDSDAGEKVEALRNYMEKGGVIVLTGAKAPAQSAWVSLLDEKLALTPVSPPSKPKDYFKGENYAEKKLSLESVPNILGVKNEITTGYKLANPREWEIGGKWAGLDSVIVKRFGKGALVLTTLDYPKKDFLENVAKMLRLKDLGIAYVGSKIEFRDPANVVANRKIVQGNGRVILSVNNTSPETQKVTAFFRVNNGKEKREARRSMDLEPGAKIHQVPVDLLVDLRGEAIAQFGFVDPKSGSEVLIGEEKLTLPEFMTVIPPAYRGMISTARRDKDVHFKLRFAPLFENMDNTTVRVMVTGPDKSKISEKEMTVSGPDIPVVMELPADAAEGRYQITAVAKRKDGREVTAEGSFKIVPVRKGQVFVDQDAVLLKDGKPFFPLGIYHVTNEQVDDVADMGFDLIQFWSQYGTPESMNRLQEKGIQALWEGHTWPRLVQLRRLLGIDQQAALSDQTFQELLQVQRDTAAKYREHPALAMWYVADEPSPSALPGLLEINKAWHEADEDHPTYLVATGEYDILQEACDVLGIDIYPVYRGRREPLTVIANKTAEAVHGVDFRKPVIAIPQAFGDNKQHNEKPEDLRAMSYLFLTKGVRGVIWYCWKETGDMTGAEGVGFHPESQKVLKEVVAETKVIAPALMEPGARQLKSKDGKIYAIICGSDVTGRYLVFVNSDETPARSVLEVPELAGNSLKTVFGSAKGEVANGELQLELEPLATGVFKIE